MEAKLLKLSNGDYVIVDAEDYDWLSQWEWHRDIGGYAKRGKIIDGKQKNIIMHREINQTPDHLQTDHINGHKNDNRKSNLRSVKPIENSWNVPAYPIREGKPVTSKYKGVSWHKDNKKWVAAITIKGKRISLGNFDDELKAAKAWDEAAKKYRGSITWLNFPEKVMP